MNLLTNVVRVLIIGFIQLHPCYGESDPQVCLPDQFQCSIRHCIPNQWRCDGESDCDGGVDEIDCGNTTERCSKNQFRCLRGSRCIHANWRCDGDRDCNDGSDEESCENSVKKCSDNHFHCATENSCMPLHWRCDGERDCNDGSDEENCEGDLFLCLVVPVTTEAQCPDFYCKQNVECIVINHEYNCL
ncbi:hypothetical protein CDAR_251401 [Caerostris darwini]|uniref:Uncharacterized protein n=1 Tax=Caerostris darwini TaxID=1538125 RepID=A0AAV4R470_9ARAC|nr:hypothetical protein CDAR_251401 [Caerostris darwini]